MELENDVGRLRAPGKEQRDIAASINAQLPAGQSVTLFEVARDSTIEFGAALQCGTARCRIFSPRPFYSDELLAAMKSWLQDSARGEPYGFMVLS